MDEEKAAPYPSPHNATPWRLISEAAQSLKSSQSLDEEDIEKQSHGTQDEDEGSQQQQRDDYNEADIESADQNLVDWDGSDDPANPLNWSRARKWWITMITAFLTFVVSFGSSVFSAGTEVTAEQFGVSNEVMILGVSLYVVGFACGYVSSHCHCWMARH